MTPEQMKAALRSAGYIVMSEGVDEYGAPMDTGNYVFHGPQGRTFPFHAARATGIPEETLTAMAGRLVATPEESSSLYPSRGGTGFFASLLGGVGGVVGGLTDTVVDPVANALNVHPDAIKAAAALAGMYYGGGGSFFDATTGAAVPEATAVELIGPQLSANAGAPAVAAAAPAVATASPVVASPLAQMGGPNILMDFPANMIDASLGQAYSNLGVGANALAPSAGINASAPVFDPASALETQLTATGTPAAVSPAAVTPVTTNALSPTFDPASAAETQLTATPDVTGLPPGALDTLAKFAKDYGVPLASLISGITGSQAAKSAADVQAQSAREARELAKQIYEKQVSLQEPFRTAGITAQNQLLTLLGLPGGTQGAEYGKYARPFGMQDFQADPGYAFRLSEGMKALEASRAAQRGGSTGLLSGATGKALQRYGQDLASQEYGNAFNRYQTERANRLTPLGSLTTMGQSAASNQGTVAGQYGTTAGGLTTDIGAVQAAGQLGSAKAISNALSAYGNYLGNQNLAQTIRESLYNR